MPASLRALTAAAAVAVAVTTASSGVDAPFTGYAPITSSKLSHGATARSFSAAAGNYTEMNGYLADGDDLITQNVTFAQATALCDATPGCAGFTFDSATRQPTTPFETYFKSAVNFVAATGWTTWVLGAVAPYPDVNATVGGLKLSLRSTSHTVQLLQLDGDPMPPHNFSFVPPLVAFNRPDRVAPGMHQVGGRVPWVNIC